MVFPSLISMNLHSQVSNGNNLWQNTGQIFFLMSPKIAIIFSDLHVCQPSRGVARIFQRGGGGGHTVSK